MHRLEGMSVNMHMLYVSSAGLIFAKQLARRVLVTCNFGTVNR